MWNIVIIIDYRKETLLLNIKTNKFVGILMLKKFDEPHNDFNSYEDDDDPL
jgi:hypothetical protein